MCETVKKTDITPLVSICCITYNHANLIRGCIEGFLMQKTDFPLEVLIHDDCSTDGTTEIIKEYEKKYPDLIFPLYENVNQYSNGKAGEIDFFNYKRARGKYIAYCEGDDWWTDPNKLQKQVDFLETHPDYSVCYHICRIYETYSGVLRPLYNDFPGNDDEDIDVTPELFLKTSIGQPLSMVFRKSMYSLEWQKHYSNYCDSIESYHLLREGLGRFMKFTGGQYNLHLGGISATANDDDRSLQSCIDVIEMYNYTGDKILVKELEDAFFWCLAICRKEHSWSKFWKANQILCFHTPLLWIIFIIKSLKRKISNGLFNNHRSRI